MGNFLGLFNEDFFIPFNITLVAFLAFLALKIKNQGIPSFKYIFYAWCANITLLIIVYFQSYFEGKGTFFSLELIDYSIYYLDLVSSSLIIVSFLKYKNRHIVSSDRKAISLLFLLTFLIIILLYVFDYKLTKPFKFFSHLLSVISLLIFLVLVINVFRDKFKKKPSLMIIGIIIYLLVHIVLMIGDYIRSNDTLVDFLAVIAKILILSDFFKFFVFNQNLIIQEEIDKRAEEERLNEELEKSATLNNELNEILGWTFHELSSPKLSLGSTLIELSETNKNREDIIEKIKGICLREFYLFESVIDASQKMYIDANPELKEADIFETKVKYDYYNVNTAIQMAVLSFKKKNTSDVDGLRVYNEAIDFELDYGGNCIAYISSEFKLIRLFTNLIKNSFQASNGKLVTIYIKTRIKKLSEGGKVILVEFEDNGPGIKKEIQNEIFNRGFSTKTPNKDTPIRGIGLYEVKNMIDENDGKIRLESPPVNPYFNKKTKNEGTKFILTFNTIPFNKNHTNN